MVRAVDWICYGSLEIGEADLRAFCDISSVIGAKGTCSMNGFH